MSKKEKEEVREVIIEKNTGFNYLEMIIIMVISILFGFLIGNVVNFVKDTTVKTSVPKELEELVTTYDDIVDNYYKKVDKEELLDAAIAGMVGYLDDPYSSYLNVSQSEQFNQTVDGEYIGIGTTVSYQDNQATLVELTKDGPADKAGLKEGDIIKVIDGQDVTSKTLSEIVSLIKGKKGTTVKITVERDGKNVECTVLRDTVEIQSVTSKVYEQNDKKIGYLKVDVFAANTGKQFEKALEQLEKKKINSLIVDVRDNPGGHLTQASEILSLFLTKKQVMYQIENKGKKEKVYALSNEKRSYPIAVLINEESASASEIVASAMKETYKASIVGVHSYGKGTVQRSFTLKSGSTIKYTTEKWYTAKGNWINEKGVEPTDIVEQSEAFKENGQEADDTQLAKALEILGQK